MSRTISLARHLMLCKNMRAVFVYDPDDPPDREAFTWLAGQHQYQNIGVPASIFQASRIELDAFETFTKLRLPNDSLNELKTAGAKSHPEWVIESIILGSAYVLPMILDRAALDRFEQFCEWRAETVGAVPKDQIVRHVQIIGYGMQELFEESTEQALNALHRSDLHSEMVRRQSIAAADGTERFWRLLEIDEPKNYWIGGYFDVLPALPADVTTGLGGEAAIGLGLVGGVGIEPPYTDG